MSEDDGIWQFDLPITAPLNLNHRVHYMVRAKRVAEVRDAAKKAAQELGIPTCRKVRVSLIYTPRDNRRRDSLNLVATLKPVEDGLVDAGIVPDDTPQYLESQMPLIDIADKGAKAGRLTVYIEKVL